jgi:hypothetical protein
MKKTGFRVSLVAILLSFHLVCYSQTDKGSFLVGGQYVLDFNSNTKTFNGSGSSYEMGKYRTFEVSPQIGFFVFRNIPVGMEFLYSDLKIEVSGSEGHTMSYNIIPFIRYYFGQSKVKPYVHLGAGPGWQKMVSSDFGYRSTGDGKLFRYQVKGGICAFINENISVDFCIGYKSVTENSRSYSSTGSGDYKLLYKDFDVVLGLSVYL